MNPRNSATVLVIDDSLTSREDLKAHLEASGYTVFLAETGEKGLNLAVELRPNVMVVDGQLPGIDGATVVRRVKSDSVLRGTPCILLTASEDRNDEFIALEAGADTYVRKDEDTAVLLARLAAILRSASENASVVTGKSLLAPKKIMAVDDSPTYLNQLADSLRNDGYDVVLANSGEIAIELLKKNTVDCILLDLIMPGLSGHESCRQIKREPKWRDIPLLILTAQEGREAMIEGFNAGADDYLPKSSQFDVLKARMRAQLRRKQFEDENRSMREALVRKEVEAVEARASRELAETRAQLLSELQISNKELEAFSYSVSHDLRTPLRAMVGFTQMLMEDKTSALSGEGREYLERVMKSAQRMGQLVDGLLSLSRLTRHDLTKQKVDLSDIANTIVSELQMTDAGRNTEVMITPSMVVNGDPKLLQAAVQNLVGNAWKFSSKNPSPRIEFGFTTDGEKRTYFIRDNGAGFDMRFVDKLFGTFQRLHGVSEFEGTGIGLATVQRIIHRHGGEIWAEGVVGQGATFFFTL